MVTVLPSVTEADRDDWWGLSQENLARAYGESEPEYSERDVRQR